MSGAAFPELLPGAAEYWWAFSEIAGDRPITLGASAYHSPIPSASITSMAEYLWPGDFDEQMRFRSCVRSMDWAQLAYLNSGEQEEVLEEFGPGMISNPPGLKQRPKTRAPVEPALFDERLLLRMFGHERKSPTTALSRKQVVEGELHRALTRQELNALNGWLAGGDFSPPPSASPEAPAADQ